MDIISNTEPDLVEVTIRDIDIAFVGEKLGLVLRPEDSLTMDELEVRIAKANPPEVLTIYRDKV